MADQSVEDYNRKLASLYGSRERYADTWRERFVERYQPFLREGMTILDVGSGRLPAIPVEERPANCRYLGLDISAEELALAPSGSYDESYVKDLRVHEPALDNQVDLIVSWQVLEHIEPLSDAVRNIHGYLKPGGHFVGLLSGRNAHFSIINRIVPEKLGVWAMKHLLNRPPDTVFRAHYDSCTDEGLRRVFGDWRGVEIVSHYIGAVYFSFFKPASRAYLVYEDWLIRNKKTNLATHYTVIAEK